jgi:uncharacterized integral membrane protein
VQKLAYWIVTIPLFIAVVMFSIANYQMQEISLWPLADRVIAVPLYAVVLVAMLLGVLLGSIIAWIQGSHGRQQRRILAREVTALKRQVGVLRGNKVETQGKVAETSPAS